MIQEGCRGENVTGFEENKAVTGRDGRDLTQRRRGAKTQGSPNNLILLLLLIVILISGYRVAFRGEIKIKIRIKKSPVVVRLSHIP